MHCSYCDRDMTRCICPDADERIESCKNHPNLDSRMFEVIQAERLLAKPEIDADRAANPLPPRPCNT